MAKSRSNITWDSNAYHQKLRRFDQRLNPKGSCYGYAHTSKHALIATDVPSFVNREEVFEVGAPLSAQNSNRVFNSNKICT